MSFKGEEVKRKRPPKCPYCSARPDKLSVSVEKLPGGGRWTTAKVVTCEECGFAWRSRTSANAVTYHLSERQNSQKRKKPTYDNTQDSSEDVDLQEEPQQP